MNEPPCVVDARGLHYRYPDGTPGLGSIDFQVSRGECLGLAGPNGSGKSTLLHHLAGVHAAPGHLWVCGHESTRRGLSEIRRCVGFLFQNPDDQLFLPTVGEDLAFGLRARRVPENEVRERVAAGLARLGLEHLVDRPTHRLSGGEKQGVALASALVDEPEILALDEPTNDLDAGSRRRLIEFLAEWEGTVVVASHDLEFLLEASDRVALLDGGALVVLGGARAVLSDRERLERHGLEEPASIRALREAQERKDPPARR